VRANSLQIARRLRAMIEIVFALLPAYRHAPLLQEEEWLDAALEAWHWRARRTCRAWVARRQGHS
jgi:hypothetical protein